jgi:hypothetical protein
MDALAARRAVREPAADAGTRSRRGHRWRRAIGRRLWCALGAVTCALGAVAATPDAGPAAPPPEAATRSPWLLVPLVSSSPKLGTSLGAMIGYVRRLDAVSPPSVLLLQGSRSSTQSTVLAAGGKFYWNEDRDRLFVGLVGGTIHNDYQDFVGSGQEVRTEEDLRAFVVRYLHRVAPHWMLGVQGLKSNYAIDGEDAVSSIIIDQVGLVGSEAAGVGLVLQFDTRDNVNNPSRGTLGLVHNIAYRERLGGDNDYDALNADLRHFLPTGPANVVALHASARWTWDAPTANQSSIEMRGYTRGQYLGRNSLTLEAEDRYMFRPRWGAKLFGGVTCLYGKGRSCGEREQLYPMVGTGVFYLVKPEAGMVVAAEFAKGKGENRGFYLRFGQPF